MFKKYQNNKNMHAYESRYYDNVFHKNAKGKFGVFTPATAERGNKDINLSIFENPNALNFKFKNKPAGFVNIPFEKIGLYKDSYRCEVPNKNQYRSKVKQRFNNRPVHDDKARYNRNTVNNLLYYNSGKMVLDLVPCYGKVADPPVVETGVDEYRYDLGTASSPVFKDYKKMTNANLNGVYSWRNVSKLFVADRGNINGANNLNRDFLFGQGENNMLIHNVANGFWRVVVTFGDAKDPRDNMQIKAEGKTIGQQIATKAGEFKNSDFTIQVKDKKLNLEFIDAGGRNNRWSVSRIWLRKVASATPAPVANAIPFGKYISLQKAGGNKGFVAAEPSGRLIANRKEVKKWEIFLVEKHPKGGVALKALSNNKYIQVPNTDENAAVRPNGNGKYAWEQFEWKTLGGGKVALKSMHTNKWLQAAWNNDNAIVVARGGSPKNWETFNWKVESKSGAKDLEIDASLVSIYPVPANDILHVKLALEIENSTYSIYDSLGKLIRTKEVSNSLTLVDVSNLETGIYFLKIKSNEASRVETFVVD
ncbi:T9SS type A sorting domain-containing protein [Aquimarina agarivorans]|uniref:T9SS type A sorting domain-containing protein n=1 Tax=Aquimarina agarivorans TaxID=980584 RepID=UPI001300C6D6|nr:T9SS type A sorting domain-containing protein [Aquimarina agarivorans]